MRRALVAALGSCADRSVRAKAHRFLAGLSYDELQFFAEYLGASVLECDCQRAGSRAELAERIAEFEKARRACGCGASADQDHKMILLLEFLCLRGIEQAPLAVRASR